MVKNYDFLDLKTLVEINSYTKNKEGVDRSGELFSSWMQKIGFKEVRHKRADIGDHLLFCSPFSPKDRRVLLLGHLDTVFPPDVFDGFREDKEWIYGAGVCDMKGGNMVALEALRSIYRDVGEIKNIDMLLVSDEETGSDDSKELTLSIAKDYDYCLVYEAAGVDGRVVTSRKGVGTFFIDIEGRASHAGNEYQSGVDANLEAAYKVIALTKLTDLSKGTTVNVGKIEGGVGANTISPNAKLTLELRYTSTKERDRVLDGFDKITNNSSVNGISSTLSGAIQRDVMQESKEQLEFLKKIEKLLDIKIKKEHRGGVSDANHMASSGVTTIDGFGPFGDGDHTTKERACKKSYFERIDLSSRLLLHFVKGSI